MPDNTQLNTPTTSGDIIATDDIAGVKFQRVKITVGADGVNDGDISSSNPLPVAATSLPLPTGASTSANQTNGTQKTQLVDAAGDVVDVKALSAAPVGTEKGLVTQSIIHGLNSGGGGTYVDVKVNPAGKLLVTADLEQGGVAVGAANPVQVTLANTGANATAVKVDGSAVTQPVSGPLTDTQLRATPVPVSGTVSTGLTQPLTDTQLRATAVPVSGTITANLGTLNGAATDRTTAASPFANRLTDGTSFYDARQVRALTSSDVVTVANPQTSVSITGTPSVNATLSAETTKVIGTVNVSAGQSITANAGTNLNTSALNLETTQAAMSAKLPAALGQTTMANSLSVAIASNQSAVQVSQPDTIVIGQAAQTATVNNILTTTSGTAATDVSGLRSGSIQVVSTGTGGTFIFEQSNDDVNYRPMPVFNSELTTSVPIVAAITATNSQIIYTFPIRSRYIRLRIATTITGGSIQAFSRFSQESWSPAIQAVGNSTAANMLVQVSGSLTANQSVNVSQINAVTPLMGNGVTGTGSQRVTVASDNTPFGVLTAPTAVATNAMTRANSTALEASRVLKASAGRLYYLTVTTNRTSDQYFQIFNSTTVPADTTAPIYTFKLPADSTIQIDFGEIGAYFSTGISASNSTTIAAKTTGSADCFITAEIA